MKCFQTKYKLLCLYKGDADLTFTFATNVFLSLFSVASNNRETQTGSGHGPI